MSTHRWSVRTAQAQDAPGIAAIFNDTWPHALMDIADQVRDRSTDFYVLTEGSAVLAFLSYSEWHNWPAIRGMETRDPDRHDALLVDWLAVTASRRDQSLGRHLVRKWIDQLPVEIEYVMLNPQPVGGGDATAAELRLRRFYTTLGFQLLPDPIYEEASYLLGWARAGAPLPAPPPWPQRAPTALTHPDLVDSAAAADIRLLRERLKESSRVHD